MKQTTQPSMSQSPVTRPLKRLPPFPLPSHEILFITFYAVQPAPGASREVNLQEPSAAVLQLQQQDTEMCCLLEDLEALVFTQIRVASTICLQQSLRLSRAEADAHQTAHSGRGLKHWIEHEQVTIAAFPPFESDNCQGMP